MIVAVLLTILTTIFIATAQVIWKIGLEKIGGFYIEKQNLFENIFRIAFSVYIIGGLLLYVIATIIFFYLLNQFPISIVVPLSSISFIFSMIAGVVIFKEDVDYINWIGAAVLILGVYLTTKR